MRIRVRPASAGLEHVLRRDGPGLGDFFVVLAGGLGYWGGVPASPGAMPRRAGFMDVGLRRVRQRLELRRDGPR